MKKSERERESKAMNRHAIRVAIEIVLKKEEFKISKNGQKAIKIHGKSNPGNYLLLVRLLLEVHIKAVKVSFYSMTNVDTAAKCQPKGLHSLEEGDGCY